MTDDKEERRRTPSRKALNAVVQELNCAINSCENASLQRDFQAVHDWLLNPLAPKHTDKEYAELLMLWEAQAVTIASMLHREDKYRLRIKELEAQLKLKEQTDKLLAKIFTYAEHKGGQGNLDQFYLSDHPEDWDEFEKAGIADDFIRQLRAKEARK